MPVHVVKHSYFLVRMKYSVESFLWRPVARVTFRFATQNNRKKEIAVFVWPRLPPLETRFDSFAK